MLSIKNLTITANEKEIIHNLSLDFLPGKIYAIMGINGSGKSTLARAIMGDPALTITNGTITLDDSDITELLPHKRAHKGIFLSPQTPLAIPGVTVGQLLRTAIDRKDRDSKTLTQQIKKIAVDLNIKKELLTRSLNDQFSGGERKKMEVLQAAVLDPTYILLDEIDTGVDIDALKIIAQFIGQLKKDTAKTLIIITHYNRILAQLPVDEVFVMQDGHITDRGDATLAQKIEDTGYTK